MKRRNFIAASAATVLGAVGLRVAVSDDQSAIVKIIRKKLHYLKIDDADAARFAADAVREKLVSSTRLRVYDAAGWIYTRLSASANGTLGTKIGHTEDRITTQFLISSDFFANGADTSRRVTYLGYYDPMIACKNPFYRRLDAGSGA
jgi:hypothetical protein